MKILILANRIPFPLNDGGNIATYNAIIAYTKLGYDVYFYCLNPKKHRQSISELQKICRVTAIDIDTDIQYFKLFASLFQKFPYNVKRFFDAKYLESLITLLKDETFDIIQTEGPYMGMYIEHIKKYTQAKFILRAHNVEWQIWERVGASESNILRKLYLKNLTPKIKKYETEIIKKYDGVMTISKNDSAEFNKYTNKIFYFPQYLELEKYTPTKNKNLNALCFIGSFEWIPNLQGLMWFLKEIWPALKIKFPNLTLDIAGKNPPESLLQVNIPDVKIIGEVENAIAYLDQYKILIAPLLSGSGIRIKLIEAMAKEMVVISTTIGAEGIAYTNGENIFIADQKLEFIAQMAAIQDKKFDADLIGKNARKLIESEFNQATILTELHNYFNSL